MGVATAIGIGIGVALVTGQPVAGVSAGLPSALMIMVLIGPWFTESPGHVDFHFRGRLTELLPVLRDVLIVGALGALVGWLTALPLGMDGGLTAAREIRGRGTRGQPLAVRWIMVWMVAATCGNTKDRGIAPDCPAMFGPKS
ncbi:hypothetical protein [Nonomuraea sp. NPDC046570]|uniref:hypothetical protein n=1 Tax=Nonomuraea sp. NPDC046570 TaxID=3155255 RepID=UPI0033F70326